ncbi:hypothetical protein EYF80_053436 [Liparis tanakae]|uniref:Uncharacterized protein n=1 Tax=Liparis tanakae TaxID=230148 RepID=A0A4Z2F5L6_9TELE|nr:hypothetical protein EYF80_053436 [Liparis tanakae]
MERWRDGEMERKGDQRTEKSWEVSSDEHGIDPTGTTETATCSWTGSTTRARGKSCACNTPNCGCSCSWLRARIENDSFRKLPSAAEPDSPGWGRWGGRNSPNKKGRKRKRKKRKKQKEKEKEEHLQEQHVRPSHPTLRGRERVKSCSFPSAGTTPCSRCTVRNPEHRSGEPHAPNGLLRVPAAAPALRV